MGTKATTAPSTARGRPSTRYATTPMIPTASAPLENVKSSVAAVAGTKIAPATRAIGCSSSLEARWTRRIVAIAAMSPSAFQ